MATRTSYGDLRWKGRSYTDGESADEWKRLYSTNCKNLSFGTAFLRGECDEGDFPRDHVRISRDFPGDQSVETYHVRVAMQCFRFLFCEEMFLSCVDHYVFLYH